MTLSKIQAVQFGMQRHRSPRSKAVKKKGSVARRVIFGLCLLSALGSGGKFLTTSTEYNKDVQKTNKYNAFVKIEADSYQSAKENILKYQEERQKAEETLKALRAKYPDQSNPPLELRRIEVQKWYAKQNIEHAKQAIQKLEIIATKKPREMKQRPPILPSLKHWFVCMASSLGLVYSIKSPERKAPQ